VARVAGHSRHQEHSSLAHAIESSLEVDQRPPAGPRSPRVAALSCPDLLALWSPGRQNPRGDSARDLGLLGTACGRRSARREPDRREPALRAPRVRRRPSRREHDALPLNRATNVSLRRWLRRQLRQPEPLRERLEAAIAENDPAEARRVIAQFEFSEAQRRHVIGLIEEWEGGLRVPAADDLNPPGAA
jgi:hypothetical protein